MMAYMAELVGILNLTPDSFSESGEFFYRPQAAMAHADRLFEEGAAIVDVGAESTRPRAIPLDQETEWRRLEPVLGKLIAKYPGRISLDTRHPEIARRAFELDAGEVIIKVIDDGPGIPEAARNAALLRGVQLDSTGGGSGLGLAIVSDIVEAYGGRLAMANAGPGLVVTIYLPRHG